MNKVKDEQLIIGEHLKTLRNNQSLTQKQLSYLSGISRSTLSRYEKGQKLISKKNIEILSQFFDLDDFLAHKEIYELLAILLEYQANNNISKYELANKLNVDASTLSKILNRKRLPNANIINKIKTLIYNSNNKEHLLLLNIFSVHSYPKVHRKLMGKRIRSIRIQRSESQVKFGNNFILAVGKNVVSRWEKGINIPDIERLMNIAFLGNTTVTTILFGEYFEFFLVIAEKQYCNFIKLNSNQIGLRLRKIRKNLNLEREEFGKYFVPFANKSSIDRYENGKDVPNTERLIQYAYLGKVSLQFLIYGIE